MATTKQDVERARQSALTAAKNAEQKVKEFVQKMLQCNDKPKSAASFSAVAEFTNKHVTREIGQIVTILESQAHMM